MLLTVLGNVGYGLMFVGFFARDVLWLRGVLATGQAIVAFYTWRNGVHVVSAWNVAFMLINAVMAVQILNERRAVSLPEDLRTIYEQHFAALTPPEFLRWWRQGHREQVSRGALTRTGVRPEALTFVVTGAALVRRQGRDVATLASGDFVGEMSLITGRPANADVDIVATSDIVRWSRDELETLRERSPVLWTKIQSVIGLDLVQKVRRAETT
jgi:CRP-like cAMP-binding protein